MTADSTTVHVPIYDTAGRVVRLGDLILSASGPLLVVIYNCDDDFYSFRQPLPLGRLLCYLGLTAEDCARAIAEWKAASDQAPQEAPQEAPP